MIKHHAYRTVKNCTKSTQGRSLEIQDLLDVTEQLKGKYVIVEGKKDEEALKRLGLKNIIKIAGERNLHDIPFTLNHNKEIVILTDFDKAGKKLASRVSKIFKAHKIRVNSALRRRFMHLGKTRIEDYNLFLRKLSLK